ncbi:MAG: hypothetical protein OXC05_05135 [Halieaceae bacterium]|nr:hypothetical protein [Halieaceae bacterium]
MSIHEDALKMCNNPKEYFNNDGYNAHHMPLEELHAMQLAGAQARFSALRDQIPVLQSVADNLGIDKVDSFEAIGLLLFPHTMYKSYPSSFLEKSRFTDLTKWLDRLTAVSISSLPVGDCETIDEWLDVLDDESQLRVLHSSGTSGTMSFLPRTKREYETFFGLTRMCLLEALKEELRPGDNDFFHVISLGFSTGRSGALRAQQAFREQLAGSDDRYHPLHDVPMSSDVMYMAARLRRAEARGEIDSLVVNPKIRARRQEFEETQRSLAQSIRRLFDEVIAGLIDQRVFMVGMWSQLQAVAGEGLARGITEAFAPGSIVQGGGGAKGAVMEDGWEDDVKRFAGVQRFMNTYGMSELMSVNYLCEDDRFHLQPWIVPMILDPDSSKPLPRAGVQTGRAGFMDLLAQTYWGGFISGDEVTIDWLPCRCGRTSPNLKNDIRRFSDKQGGDDKINCAAADEAHGAAINFLASDLG